MCAGGGITGAVYEVGCLRALEELLDRRVTDLDLYVGVSGGAFVASLLAAGVSPREMFDEVTARTTAPFGVAAAPLFRLNALEFLKRSLRARLPAGLLETSGIREYLQALYRLRNRADRFDDLHHPLFVVAVDLDRGEAVAFGDHGFRDVPVSRAVEASTALPGLYRPVRIDGRDYVDGGVKKTAHIKLAIDHGADLVICINPLVPILNDTTGGPLGGHLSEHGVTYVLDQAMRIMLHGRMEYGMERYRREHPEVDIVLIEPVARRPADVQLQHHAIQRAEGRGRARLPFDPRTFPQGARPPRPTLLPPRDPARRPREGPDPPPSPPPPLEAGPHSRRFARPARLSGRQEIAARGAPGPSARVSRSRTGPPRRTC